MVFSFFVINAAEPEKLILAGGYYPCYKWCFNGGRKVLKYCEF